MLSKRGGGSTDSGSVSTRDPSLAASVNVTDTYYLAVHSETRNYVNDTSRFTGRGGTGDYTLVVSSTSNPQTTSLTNDRDNRTYGDTQQNIQALGGNNVIFLRGGNDIASGGSGNDSLYGGSGDDELAGGSGVNKLYGGSGADVLVGGSKADILEGGGNDALNGGGGNDVLFAEAGNDSLIGNSGSDKLFWGRR